MKIKRLDHHLLNLSSIHNDLLDDLKNEKDISDVIRLISVLNELRDMVYDIRIGMLDDEQKHKIAKLWNNL